MSRRNLLLFDDAVARRWAPFASTRPVGELLLGSLTLRARAEAVLDAACAGHWSHAGLQGFVEPGCPPVIPRDGLPEATGSGGSTDDLRILLSSRVALAWDGLPDAIRQSARLVLDGRTVGWALPPGAELPDDERILHPDGGAAKGHGGAAFDDGLPELEISGALLEAPWSLMSANEAWLLADGAHLWTTDDTPVGVHRLGDHPLSLASGARVEPGVVVDTRNGPVRLEEGAAVQGPARLTGPLWLGPGTVVLGGDVGTSSVGPVCKVRGEVAESILLGFDNKAHDGHLGHAVLGRWVNLGAGTTNSDLKNNYGSVRVWTPEGPADTGLSKVGSFLGDHVKTAIGTLLPTGAVVGAGANVFGGGGFAPTRVPPFAWGVDPEAPRYRLEAFLETAERAMARRDQTLDTGLRAVLSRAWEQAQDPLPR